LGGHAVETTQSGQSKKGGARLSEIAREKKLRFFFGQIPQDAKILDFGCADGWAGKWARGRGWSDITGLDITPPADIVGDIHEWRKLGLEAHSFDAILAFEVIEHGDFAAPLHDLLRPDGRLMATTPVPRMDWACQIGEALGLFQRRTSPHSHLTDLRQLPGFSPVQHQVKGFISQWGILRPV
jgi:2-polyprenyl-3-methyl-5-hydroxy-6-metoxy-1,4-benzoquinol methylase